MDGAVCVIDGDPGVRRSLEALLRTLPVRVLTFSAAEEFLARLNEGTPCLLFAELSLPGITGLELMEELRARNLSFPKVGLTADPSPELMEALPGLGLDDLLEKPFVYWAVVHRVQEALKLPA